MLSIAQHWFLRRRRVDDERLLRLFWKRAELKKEFAELRRERDRMVDLLRQQEGATMRSQQRLEHLEGYLADPVRAANAGLFFQLRGVWQLCHRRLARLARDMESRQQEAEARREQTRFDEHRQAALTAIEQRVAALRDRQAVLDREGETLQVRWSRLGGFWNCFQRRRIETDIGRVHIATDGVVAQIERYEKAAAEKRHENAPPVGPLSVEGKRLVNILVVALAQEMLLHFNEHGMASMAREASLRSVTDTSYGSIEECRVWSQRIEAASRRFDELGDLPARIERRAKYLRRQAQYRREADTVPVAGSFETIPWRLTDDEDPQPRDGRSLRENVLADEYWNIYSVLLT